MKQIILTSALIGLTIFPSCDCDDIFKAELFIKKTQQLYDYVGNPLINLFTGQPITTELPNAIFYNERTGEYFNPEFGPSFPTLVGDIIQFTSAVTNEYLARRTKNCGEEKLITASPSKTSLPIEFTFPNGSIQTYDIQGNVPPIEPGNYANGAGRFRINGPGVIKVNEVTADQGGTVDEFIENNNITQIGTQTSVTGRVSKNYMIRVEGTRGGDYIGVIQLPHTKEPKDMEIFKNLNSESFSRFVTAHYVKKSKNF